MQAGILGCSQTLKTSFLASKAICNCSQTKHYSHFVLLFLMLNIAFTYAISAAFEESLSWESRFVRSGRIVQSIKSPTADPGVTCLTQAQSHTIDHEMISTVIFLSADSRKVGVSFKQKYVQEVLVNGLVRLAQEKVWFGEPTVST